VKKDLFLSAQKEAKTAPKTNKQANKQNKTHTQKNKNKKMAKISRLWTHDSNYGLLVRQSWFAC
jgi:hypothetical protein